MHDEEPVCVPLASCFKLSGTIISNAEDVVEYMSQVLDERAVENLTDAMVYT